MYLLVGNELSGKECGKFRDQVLAGSNDCLSRFKFELPDSRPGE
jgi:hypothetical protein